MATWTLSFRSAGLVERLRRRWSARAACAEPVLPGARQAAARADSGHAVSRRRAEAMRRFFPKLSSWMAHQGHLTDLSEVDRFLSQSTDIFDLERRIREIERRGSTTRWFQ